MKSEFETRPLDDPDFLQFQKNRCHCYECNKDRTVNGLPYALTRMILCPICGNKRCPHATDHNLACTNSNEPNQTGSRYSIEWIENRIGKTDWENWKPNKDIT